MLSGQRERILLLCPSVAPQAIQKLPLQTFVLCSLCYKGPFITTLAFRTLPSAKVTFHLSFILWYTDAQTTRLLFSQPKKSVREEVWALKWNVNLIFFFFGFGIPYFQKHFPSNPMVVVFACYAFSVPNILLRHSKGTFMTFYGSSFPST